MRIRTLISCVPVMLVALLGLASSSGAESACGCTQQDKTDLESRIKQVEAAMKEYDSLTKEWEAKEKSSGEPLLLNSTHRNSVQGSVGFRMSGVHDPNAQTFGAETNPICVITIDPAATNCLRGALQDHESVHKAACEANKTANPFVDWRSKQRVVDYMKEEKAGYQKELDRLKDELSKMQTNCRKITKLDPSALGQLRNAIVQRERSRSASDRLQMYGTAIN